MFEALACNIEWQGRGMWILIRPLEMFLLSIKIDDRDETIVRIILGGCPHKMRIFTFRAMSLLLTNTETWKQRSKNPCFQCFVDQFYAALLLFYAVHVNAHNPGRGSQGKSKHRLKISHEHVQIGRYLLFFLRFPALSHPQTLCSQENIQHLKELEQKTANDRLWHAADIEIRIRGLHLLRSSANCEK